MKILPSSKAIQAALIELMDTHDHFSWAVAWATTSCPAHRALRKHQDKVKQLIVGIHFYQTDPDFLEVFVKSPNARMVKSPSGVFHPKVYVFWSGSEHLHEATRWEALVGSANFTGGGLNSKNTNTEAAIRVSSEDIDSEDARAELNELLTKCWGQGKEITAEGVAHYRSEYAKRAADRARLAGVFLKRKGKAKGAKQKGDGGLSVLESELLTYPWATFVEKVRGHGGVRFNNRLQVLSFARQFFRAHSFGEMSTTQQRMIAGVFHSPKDASGVEALDWGHFGSMKSAGNFQSVVKEAPMALAEALAHIPRDGQVSETNYGNFVASFEAAFEQQGRPGGKGIATATRLLAMKRPDTFLCVDDKNAIQLGERLKISRSIDLDGYWYSVVARLRRAHWNGESRPDVSDDSEEYALWLGRVALVDAILCAPADAI